MRSLIPFIVNYRPIKKLAIISFEKKRIKYIKVSNYNILMVRPMEMDVYISKNNE